MAFAESCVASGCGWPSAPSTSTVVFSGTCSRMLVSTVVVSAVFSSAETEVSAVTVACGSVADSSVEPSPPVVSVVAVSAVLSSEETTGSAVEVGWDSAVDSSLEPSPSPPVVSVVAVSAVLSSEETTGSAVEVGWDSAVDSSLEPSPSPPVVSVVAVSAVLSSEETTGSAVEVGWDSAVDSSLEPSPSPPVVSVVAVSAVLSSEETTGSAVEVGWDSAVDSSLEPSPSPPVVSVVVVSVVVPLSAYTVVVPTALKSKTAMIVTERKIERILINILLSSNHVVALLPHHSPIALQTYIIYNMRHLNYKNRPPWSQRKKVAKGYKWWSLDLLRCFTAGWTLKITRPGELGLVIFRCLLFDQSKIAGIQHGELILRVIVNCSITVTSQGYGVASDVTIKTGCTAVAGNGNIRGHCYDRTCKGISCISIDL